MIRHYQVKSYLRKPQIFKHVEIINFQKYLHMIHHLKDLDLGITYFKYQHDPTQLRETIPSQSSNP